MTITRSQAALLALLLDADGAVVTYDDLGDVLGAYGINAKHLIRQHRVRLRRRGIGCVAVVPGRGCRLVGLPPDDVLEDVLTVLDALRREGWMRPAAWGRTA